MKAAVTEQLRIDPHVLHRALAVAELCRHLPRRVAVGDQPQHLLLAVGQLRGAAFTVPGAHGDKEATQQVGGQDAGALQGRADARLEAFRRQRVFTQDAHRTGLHRGQDVLLLPA